jgi:MarR family transcriptional regulator, organic hydroperoxide resistance regulator
MPAPEPRATRLDDLIQAERDIVERLTNEDVELDFEALSLVSNLYRAASAIRRHMESHVLSRHRLSWTAFVALWVLWIWGELEARHLAAEANVTKGTLTGVLDTLEGRGLVVRRRHEEDRRLVSVALTAAGEELIAGLYPAFNAQESVILNLLPEGARRTVTDGLRQVVRELNGTQA